MLIALRAQLQTGRRLMAKWDKILEEKAYSKEEPEEIVVKFVLSLENRKSKILDLGCGAGRHLIYVKEHGFNGYGVDISKTGLNITKNRLRQRKLDCNLVRGYMNFLPFDNRSFDAVICINTLYHQKLEGIRRTIFEIYRILKRGGVLLTNFLTRRTYSYGKGKKIEENTFLPNEGIERGVLHHFTDKKEIEQLFKNFTNYTLRLIEKEVEGKLSSRYILIARK
jgi:ubiquinone/menaquinone biosynthesis C-methylase UbiE